MGTVIELKARRASKGESSSPGQFVACGQCGERHPIVRLAGGEVRCVTAFVDGDRWFCRNRGCRAAWLAARPQED